MSCSTTTTTTCYCGSGTATCECPDGVIDAGCVQYTGEDLENIDADSGDYLDEILEKLDSFTFSETNFTANSTDSIVATAGGTAGHSPSYSVRIDPDSDNALSVSALGLFVNSDNVGDGKVKVDSGDDKDYLEDQLSPANDINNIITLTPTNIAGVIYVVPTINILNLLNYIAENHLELLCEIVSACIPATTTTTSTSTTSTSTTSTTSTSTTTTTTAAPGDFIYNNISLSPFAFQVYFTDQVSLIDYVQDTTTLNGSTSNYTYAGTTNMSKVTITHNFAPTDASFVVIIEVSGSQVHYGTHTIGTFTYNNIPAHADVEVTIASITTTTTTTSTSTTTTTTAL